MTYIPTTYYKPISYTLLPSCPGHPFPFPLDGHTNIGLYILSSSLQVILFRFPWADIGQPWAMQPQWTVLTAGIIGVLQAEGIKEMDVVAHRYI